MSTIRLFHIAAALVVVFICTNNVVQGKLDAARKAEKARILKSANNVLSHGVPGDIQKGLKAVVACAATKNEDNIHSVLLKVIHLLGKFNGQTSGTKQKRRSFNDDDEEASEEQLELREFDDEEEDFEERDIAEDNAKILGILAKYTYLLTSAEHTAYDVAVGKFATASAAQHQKYIRHITKYIQLCAQGKKVPI